MLVAVIVIVIVAVIVIARVIVAALVNGNDTVALIDAVDEHATRDGSGRRKRVGDGVGFARDVMRVDELI
jgi:hypothetical protein